MRESTMNRRRFLKLSGGALAGVAVGSMLPISLAAAGDDKAPSVNVRCFTFSPTGGTLNAVSALAGMLSDAPVYEDVTLPAQREQKVVVAANELAIFAAPSYGGRTPNVALFDQVKGSNGPAVVLAAFGNRHFDDQLAEMKAHAEKQGFAVIGAIGVVTPHVFSEKVGRSRPDLQDRQGVMQQFADQVLAKLAASDMTAPEVPGDPNPPVKELKTATKEFIAEKCVNCKVCANLCPVSAIDNDTLAIDEAVCVSCQRCTFVCEFGARTYDPSGPRAYLEGNYYKRAAIQAFV